MPEISVVVDPRQSRFELLYARRYRAIYAYVRRRLEADAADVTADVFAVAWQRLDDVPDESEELLWLYGVAHHCVARARRSVRRRLRLAARLAEQTRLQAAGDDDDSRVLEAIEHLRPADREVLMLVLWEGLSHAEAALVLDCSVSAVAQRMHRARGHLRSKLSVEEDGDQGRRAWTSIS
ncbi:MAG: RNA polymerase sigma factor [Acidimicrobiales bacterium]